MASRLIFIICLLFGNIFFFSIKIYAKTVDTTTQVTFNFHSSKVSNYYVSPTRYILGNVKEGVRYSLYPEVKNKTEDTVHIGDIRKTCSCTELTVSSIDVAPEGKKVGIIFDSKGFPIGEFVRKSVYFRLPQGLIRFFYEADITKGKNLDFYPEEWKIDIKNNKKRITIYNNTGREREIKYFTTTPELLEIEKTTMKKGENHLVIRKKKEVTQTESTTLTFFLEEDESCVFSVSVNISP